MIEKGERKLTDENEAKLVEYLNTKPKADVTVLIDYLKISLKTFQYENVVKNSFKCLWINSMQDEEAVKVIPVVLNMAISKCIINWKIQIMKKILI